MVTKIFGKKELIQFGKKELMQNKKRISNSPSDNIFYIVDYIYLTLALLLVLYPTLNVIAMSLSSPAAVNSGIVYIWPVDFSINAYKVVLNNKMLLTGFGNTILYTVSGTLLQIILTIMAAYPLSRKDLMGRGPIMFYFTLTMLFGGGLIPTYLVIKSLGMVNTRWAMIIPGALGVWNMIIARTFFINTIPDELHESAEIDGASDIQVIIKLILPLSKPIIAVIGLFYAVGHWNNYMTALIYLTDSKKYNLQYIIRNILSSTERLISQSENSGGGIEASLKTAMFIDVLKYATIVVATLPIMILYPFVQKHFVKGIMIGSLKG